MDMKTNLAASRRCGTFCEGLFDCGEDLLDGLIVRCELGFQLGETTCQRILSGKKSM